MATTSQYPELLTRRQLDYLLLTMFVLSQHGHFDCLDILASALSTIGEKNPQVVAAHTIVCFIKNDWEQTLAYLEELDRIAPIERFGKYKVTDKHRMRKYLRARCLYELGDANRAKDAIASYLRYSTSQSESDISESEIAGG